MANLTATDWSVYPYTPSKAAPICFAILLSCLGLYQIYQSFFVYRWRKFGAMLTWATTVWIAGFVCRAISVREGQNIQIFIAQYVLVLMGPPLYAGAEYFILSRLLAYLPYHAPIHPHRVVGMFVMLSAFVEALTANGAAYSASPNASAGERRAGIACLEGALILQCCVEAFFFSLVALVDYRCRSSANNPRQLRPVFYTLYLTSLMVLLRCIVRTVDGFAAASCKSSSGYCGYISLHEWVLWVFEVSNITLFVVLLTIFYPGRYLPQNDKVFLDPIDGRTERVGPGFSKRDGRPFLMTSKISFSKGGESRWSSSGSRSGLW